MNQLDDAILGSLFDKRYMDFEICTELRWVSAQFNFHATRFFRSLRELDLEKLVWGSGENYDCLLETATKYCDNLEKVSGIRVEHKKCNLVSRTCLQKLPKLTSIVISTETDASLNPADLLHFLKALPNLRSVQVDGCVDEEHPAETGAQLEKEADMPEEEKVVVSELIWEEGDFWRIFRVDRLRKLSVSCNMLVFPDMSNTFCRVI